MIRSVPLSPPRGRFCIRYLIEGAGAEERAEALAWEQTVEFPRELLEDGDLKNHIPGRVEQSTSTDQGWEVDISYPWEATGSDWTQYLNVVFGNSSLQPRVKVLDLTWPEGLAPGPRHGMDGLRKAAQAWDRPLAATALKPLGLPVSALAQQAYELALGGLDLIKDDHGLADQPYARFEDRVNRIVEIVGVASRETGKKTLYAPNFTGDGSATLERARFAQKAGADAVLVSPGLVGFGTLIQLARDSEFRLPIVIHPAFSGAGAWSSAGWDHGVWFGTLSRASGGDAVIFPNHGGRFSFSIKQCQSIAQRCLERQTGLLPAFPMPGGGMDLSRLADQKALYGNDFIALVGGALHREPGTLIQAARRFTRTLGQATP